MAQRSAAPADLFAQQTIGTPAPSSAEPIEMMSPDGNIQTVSGRHAGTLSALGYQKVTPELRQQLADKAKYGGTLGELGAAGLGVARGLTFGVSDLAIKGAEQAGVLPEGTIEGARKLKEFNPNASLAGEIASFAVPALGSIKALGAAGKIARGAGAGIGAVDAVGSALGKAATKIVGQQIGKYAAPAVKAAAEAAIFQAGHNISEESLANRDLTVESVMSHVGDSAILGGGIGLGLPIALRAAKGAALAALESQPVEWVVGEAGKKFAKFLDPQRAAQLYSGAMSKGSLLEDTPAGQRFQKGVKELWDDGAYKGGIVDVDDATGLLKQVQGGRLLNQQDMLGRFRGLKDKAGSIMGDVVRDADDALAATGVVPKSFGFGNADADKVIDKIASFSKSARINDAQELALVSQLEQDALRVKDATTFKELHELRRGLDSRVNDRGWMEIGKPAVEITKDIRRIVSDKLAAGLGEIDPALATKWANANKLFGNLRVVGDAIAKQTGKTEANVNVLGLRFRDIGIGAIGGGVLGGPAGVGIAMANRAIQTDQGLLARAMLGERLQALGWLQKTTQAAQNNIAKSVASFVRGVDTAAIAGSLVRAPTIGTLTAISNATRPEPIATPVTREKDNQEWFAKTSKELIQIASDPQVAAEKQGAQLEILGAQAPKTTDALVTKWLAVNDYLLKAMPKNPGNPMNILAPQWKPADYEIDRFRDVVRVARAPLSILTDIKHGTVTRAQTQAVQALYPSLYQTMFDKVRESVTKPGVTLPYEKRLQLGTLFPGVEASMVPGFATRMNTTGESDKEQGAPVNYNASGASKSAKGSRYSTKTDNLSAR